MSREGIATNEDAYFLWVSLRSLIMKTNEKPPWELVAEAMGGNSKAHAMYMRYWNLTKKPPTPNLGKELPDLEKLLTKACKDGRINTKGEGRGGGTGVRGKKAATASAKRKLTTGNDEQDSHDEVVKPAQKKHKPKTTVNKESLGTKLEASDMGDSGEKDAEGDTEDSEI